MKPGLRKLAFVLAGMFATVLVFAQSSSTPPPPPPDPDEIIAFLSRIVTWHREITVEQPVTLVADLTTLQENRIVAGQVVQLAFEYARSQVQVQAKNSAPSQPQSDTDNQSQRLLQAAQRTDKDLQDTEVELQGVRDKLAAARPQQKKLLESQVAELESELGLLRARRDALQSMVDFVNSSTSGGGSLRARIDELARSLPSALTRTPASNQGDKDKDKDKDLEPPASVNSVTEAGPPPSGIWGLVSDLISLYGKVRALDREISSTTELQQTAKKLRAPQMSQLRLLVRQGDQLFAAADTASTTELAQEKQQLDQLTTQFKQASATMMPLSKASVLLGVCAGNLSDLRDTVKGQARGELRQLAFRLGVLLLLIAAVFGLGEVWRRTTFRYVHDARRRYQFLLLRRIAMWLAIGLVIILTFASQLGSAVTFAGLLTAGVAVALQNVIVSMVAYFFLIGKYGIRVGDRVQIAGVTGEVVDIGLVRIHLMELGGSGELQPTGRIVAFSNSVVFQPTGGVFKQIPGTNFVWHEIKLVLAPDTDYHAAKDRITQAANAALANEKESLEMQRQMMERNLSSVTPAELGPRVRLHYTASGVEAVVRFPVELEKAAETDDQVMRELLAALEREPKLKLVSAEQPVTTPD
jgi:small-conductance mechanosensitive channel